MNAAEKLKILFHIHSKSVVKRSKKAWSGISILVFKENDASHPLRVRINYYVILFFLLLSLILPATAAALYAGRTVQSRDPVMQIEGRKLVLTNLKLMTFEKITLLKEVDGQIGKFQYSISGKSEFSLDNFIQEMSRFRTDDGPAKDALGGDIRELKKIVFQSKLYLNEGAYYSLNQLWNHASIYNIIPRGRPLGAGIGNITSGYGYRIDPFATGGGGNGNFHMGIDFAAAPNTPLIATAPGVVVRGIDNPLHGYGRNVLIHHGLGYTTIYAHCNKLLVKTGDRVKRGQVIALLGKTGRATGHHVHYEVKLGMDEAMDPFEFVSIK